MFGTEDLFPICECDSCTYEDNRERREILFRFHFSLKRVV